VEENFAGLLAAARECAKYRVVVKRPGSRDRSNAPSPTFEVPGKAARFEVYVNSSFSSTPR
jgi:16S rRNA (guanine1516-N2)-methyltransferase